MKPIEKTSIIDAVVINLKNLITSGQIKVDSKLPTEKEVCEQLNVGRSTVREAFRVLQAMGFVKMIPGRGAFVAKTTEDDQDSIVNWFVEHELQIADFMEVRMALETLAVRLAITRANDAEIQAIDELHEDFEKALENHDANKLAYYDEAFHKNIADATHNQLLIVLNQKVSNAFRAYRMKSFSMKGNAANALVPHKDIVDALKTRDMEKGINAITKHINISIEDVAKVVEKI